MERMGLSLMLAGILIALLASLPFGVSVVTGTAEPLSLPGSLIWQGWALGGLVAFIGMILTMLDSVRSTPQHPAR